MEDIEIKWETSIVKSGGRELARGWKSWYCPKCGDGFLYKGKRPLHKKCSKFKIIDMMSPESKKELIECMAEEIRKSVDLEVKKAAQ